MILVWGKFVCLEMLQQTTLEYFEIENSIEMS